jgi:prefoldin subunit 5
MESVLDKAKIAESLGLLRQRIESLERTRGKVAEQYNEMESWKTRVEKLEYKYGHLVKESDEPIVPADVRELKNDVAELAAKLDAFEQALQSVVNHQGETATKMVELHNNLASFQDLLGKLAAVSGQLAERIKD